MKNKEYKSCFLWHCTHSQAKGIVSWIVSYLCRGLCPNCVVDCVVMPFQGSGADLRQGMETEASAQGAPHV